MRNDHDSVIQQCGEDLLQEAQSNYREKSVKMARKIGPNEADGLYLGMMASLGPMIPASMIAAKRPRFSEDEYDKKDPDELLKLAASFVKPETVFFVALATAHMLTAHSAETTQTEFGPAQLGRALEDWKRLFPNAKPEQIFDNHMLDAIARAERAAISPELKKKFSVFLPGNSSIN
jgi:hypothetical protein